MQQLQKRSADRTMRILALVLLAASLLCDAFATASSGLLIVAGTLQVLAFVCVCLI